MIPYRIPRGTHKGRKVNKLTDSVLAELVAANRPMSAIFDEALQELESRIGYRPAIAMAVALQARN